MHPTSTETRPSVPREGTRLRQMRKKGDIAGLVRELENPHEEHGKVRSIQVTSTVRGRAAHELSKLRAADVAKPIARLLDDAEPTVRCYAAVALGRLGDDRAGERLVAALEDPEETVLSCAVRSLGQLRFRPAVTPLVPLLDHPNVRLRIMAATALCRIGDKSATSSLKDAMRKSSWHHPVTSARMAWAMLTLRLTR